MRRFQLFILAAGVVAIAACADRSAVGPDRASTILAPDGSLGAVVWEDQITGQTGPGSFYSMNVPEDWNGTLVIYVHGFIDAGAPVALPSIDALRDAIGAEGYAVAFSSFSENGIAVRDGMIRTHQLLGLFTSRFGQPQRTLLVGSSLGSVISVAMAERYGAQLDGVLATCGELAGLTRTVQYMGDVRALFDYFYPGALPGTANWLPDITNLNAQIIGPALAAMASDNYAGASVIANIDQTPLPYASGSELVNSLVYVLAFHARGLMDGVERAHGHAPYGNTGVTYTSTPFNALMPALNTGVGRFEITADAEQWLQRSYDPSGKFDVPILSLHASRDPIAPLFNRDGFVATVAAAGNSANLVVRTIDGWGHCPFTNDQIITALNDLAAWVNSGTPPAP